MKLFVTDVPDDPARLAGWLEAHLLGLDLAALAAELTAVHGEGAGRPASLSELLGGQLDAVLSRGLSAVPGSRLGALLRHPQALLELQDLVLERGGPYWQSVPVPEDVGDVLRRGERQLHHAWTEPLRLSATRPERWYRRPWVVSLATAATVLLAVYLVPRPAGPGGPPVEPKTVVSAGWGWSRPGALVDEGPPAAYLNRLADAADEWFKKRPDDPAALAKRINEFREGCSTLIFAKHDALAAEDRRWLVERCRKWAGKLDEHLQKIESGTADVATVRGEVDATVNQLIGALRSRAESAKAT
jgi:hypothetical protein